MKVYLWNHETGVYLLNEDFSRWSKPYFITHPQRTLLLKERFEPGMDKVNLLHTITNEDLAELVNDAVMHWKPMLSYMLHPNGELLGFDDKPIAFTSI